MIILGLALGAISGMGVGGGSLLIIVLVSFFGVEQIMAQGINLLYFLPTAATALVIHIIKKRVDWRVALSAGIPGAAVAAVAGFFATNVDSKILKTAFAILILITGVIEFFKKDEIKEEPKETLKKPL